jgi:transposase
MENVPLRDLLWRVCFRRKLRPRQVTGDTTYGTVANIVALEDAGIQAFFPLPEFDHRTAFFGKGEFVFDAQANAYRCRAGETLKFRKHKHAERVRIYQAPAVRCNACLLKAHCTTSVNGRQIKRSLDEADLDRVRGYHDTEPYKKAMRKRQVWFEPLFAEAKDWHGLRRFRLRGLANANIQGLLVAAGQNLKRLLAATGWGQRQAPCGNLLGIPRAPWERAGVFS